jgi:hypothetical protein
MHQPFGNDEEFELQRQRYLDDLAELASQVQDHTVPEQEARERLARLKDTLTRLEWYEEYMNLREQGALPHMDTSLLTSYG